MRAAERPESSLSGRVLLGAALVLAVGATAMLILADDAKWLRLGIVASLWSALVGAFVAAKYRRQVADREEEAADLQSVYELELEREVAARREFELEVETEARRKAERDSQDEVVGLRKEVEALRKSLEVLFGGEVLFERVALHAESTRMRSLTEDSRPLTVRQSGVRRLTAAQSDRDTELIDRVHVTRQTTRPAAPTRPEPRRPEPSRSFVSEGSERWFAGPQATRADDLAKTIDPEWTPSWETAERQAVRPADAERAPGRRNAEAEPPGRRRTVEPVAEQAPGRRTPESTGYQNAQRPSRPAETGSQPVIAQPPGYRPADRTNNPMSGYRLAEQTGSHPQAPGYRLAEQTGGLPAVTSQASGHRRAEQTSSHRLPGQTGSQPAVAPGYRPAEQTGSYHQTRQTGSYPAVPAEPAGGHAAPSTGRPAEQTGHHSSSSSYRVAAEQYVHDRTGYTSALEQPPHGGHHAGPGTSTGHHAAEPAGGGRRRAEDAAPAGSHESGTSVSDLLAAHGQASSPRRRRRRDDD